MIWKIFPHNYNLYLSYDLKNDGLKNLDDEELIDLFNSITKLVDDPDFSADESVAKTWLGASIIGLLYV